MMLTRVRVLLLIACCTFSPLGLAQAQQAPAAKRPPSITANELLKMSKEVEKDVEAIRGWKFKTPVKTDVCSEADLRKFIHKRLFDEQLGGGRLEQTEAFLRLVGLIPSDCDMKKTMIDVLLNQVGGFYDPPTRAFYLLNREGAGYGPLVNRILIAHELTHALDDQYLDLDKLMKSREQTEDWGMAVGAVVEGSATQLMTVYSARAAQSGKFDMNELGQVAKDEMVRSQAFMDAPPYFRTLLAAYLCGMYFVVRGDMQALADEDAARSLRENMQTMAKDPPLSSEQILHPEKYWNSTKRDEPVMIDDASVTPLIEGEGRYVVHTNTVGELFCALLSTAEDAEFNIMLASNPRYWTNEAATGWGGDRFFLTARGANAKDAAKNLKELRGVWITAWDTAGDLREFVEDYDLHRKSDGRRMVKLGDRAAAFLLGYSKAEADALMPRLAKAPLRFRQGKRDWRPQEE